MYPNTKHDYGKTFHIYMPPYCITPTALCTIHISPMSKLKKKVKGINSGNPVTNNRF